MVITNVQRMSLDDGPGMRTTVFVKGCPLRCQWCHNPECIEPEVTCAFQENWPKSFVFDGDMTALVNQLARDQAFFLKTGGGITFSGGEPLLYPEFISKAGEQLQEKGISVAVDTCGFVAWESIRQVLPVTDMFLYDLKAADPLRHEQLTGQRNELIWKNLRRLLSCKKKIRIRIPVVKGANQDQLEQIISRIPIHENICQVEILPYHTYGRSKYSKLKIPYQGDAFGAPDSSSFAAAGRLLRKRGFYYEKRI